MTVWPTMPWSKATKDLKPNLSDANLVGAWNLKPLGTTIVDETVGGADMTVYGASHERTPLGDAMRFDGSSQYAKSSLADFRSSDSQGTISLWFKADIDGTAQRLFSSADEGSNTRYLSIVVSGTDYISVYQRDNDTLDVVRGNTTLIANLWHHVVLVSNGSTYSIYLDGVAESLTVASGANNGDWFADTNNRDNATIGAMEYGAGLANPFDGQICNVEVYSDAKDVDWVAQKYAQGAHMVQGKSDWGANESIANETTGYLSNTPFEISSGTWQISSDTISGEEVKVIECIATGIITIPTSYFRMNPTEGSYGTWEFWFNHADASTTVMQIISELSALGAEDGYRLYVNVAEAYGLSRRDNGVSTILGSEAGAVTAATWHKATLTRAADGEFTIYLDDTAITASTGSNPVTDTTYTNNANFMLFDMDAGDKIAYSDVRGGHSLVKYQGVV